MSTMARQDSGPSAVKGTGGGTLPGPSPWRSPLACPGGAARRRLMSTTAGGLEMRRLIPVLLIGAIALSGCGGSGSSEPSISAFKASFEAQKPPLKELGEAVGSAVTGAASKTNGELVSEFKALATRATALAGAFGQLEAPAKYKAELAALQSSLTQVAGTLNSIEAAAAANDGNAAKAGGETIVTEGQQVKSADEKLSAALGIKE